MKSTNHRSIFVSSLATKLPSGVCQIRHGVKFTLWLLLFLAFPTLSKAQAFAYTSQVQNRLGQPIRGATVTVCADANTHIPCTPTVTIYSTAAEAAQSNPLLTNSSGNFSFYAVSGNYTVTVTGNGLTGASFPISVGGGGGVSPSQVNTFTVNQVFCGQSPYVDITCYGARPVFPPTMTVNCSGSTTLAAPSGTSSFVTGDGIVIPQCGTTQSMTTPGAPTISTGVSKTQAVPDGILASVSGSSTYSYLLFGIDQHGGTTPAGATQTTTSGLSTLGTITGIAVSTATLIGTTLTINLSSPPAIALAGGARIHFTGSTDANLSGIFIVSTVGGGGATLTINNVNITPKTATTISSSGGTIVYMTGHQLTWTGSSSVFKYGICGKRPSDSSFHIIGFALPYNNGMTSSTTFTDWGTNMTQSPSLPFYLSDSNCTAVSGSNDYLATTITGGIGTTSVTIANATSQTVSGVTAKQTNGPAFRAASAAAFTFFRGLIYIPPTGSNPGYSISDYTDLSSSVGSLDQEGTLVINETFLPPQNWFGRRSAGSGTSGQLGSYPLISCVTAWPCTRMVSGTPHWESLDLEGALGPSNLIVLIDLGALHTYPLQNVNITSGTASNDYCGYGLIMRPGPFYVFMDNVTFNSSVSNSTNPDSTWCPNEYFGTDPSDSEGEVSILDWSQSKVQYRARGFYVLDNGGASGNDSVEHAYCQGCLGPVVELQNVTSLSQTRLITRDITNDTSPLPDVSILNNLQAFLSATQMFDVSGETGGKPFWLSGSGSTLVTTLTGNNATSTEVVPVGNAVSYATYSTDVQCLSNGSNANPSVVSCGSAAGGLFSCSTSATTGTCQVNDSAVTANSSISITQNQADGGASQLNVTCNTTNVLNTSKPLLVSKTASVGFTINLGTVTSNPACFEFSIVN